MTVCCACAYVFWRIFIILVLLVVAVVDDPNTTIVVVWRYHNIVLGNVLLVLSPITQAVVFDS